MSLTNARRPGRRDRNGRDSGTQARGVRQEQTVGLIWATEGTAGVHFTLDGHHMAVAPAIASANGATEANHVSVGVGGGALPLAKFLILGAVHVDTRPSPFLSYPIGVLTVQVEDTVTRKVIPSCLSKMDREVPIPVSEGIGVIVEGHVETCTFEPGNRANHIGDLENWFEPRDHPRIRHELQLAVPLTI